MLVRLRPPPTALAARLPAPGEALPRPERHLWAVRALRANAEQAQAALLERLREAERDGSAADVEPLWIANVVRAELTPARVREIASRSDVERVILDRRVALQTPADALAGEAPLPAGEPSSALATVRVEEAWDLGLTGRGILVANLDSGVDGDHPLLAGKWRGLRVPVEQAWFDPYRNSTFPVDDDPVGNGHGTATMGLLVAGERSVGVAFEAEWIAANIFENNQSFVSTILKGMQWATDPDGDPATSFDVPDVINASFGLAEIDSLGFPTDRGLCDDVFDDAVDAAGAAGAVVVFSAGNFNDPGEGDITSPGSSPNAFAVGAVDDQGQIASFSGRGPSLCVGTGEERRKPTVVAPGVSVRTLNRQGGLQQVNGTSFAAPIVGGVVALLRQKNPQLSADDLKDVLEATARDLGVPGPDNTFGSGLVDALAAVTAVSPGNGVLRLTGFERAAAAVSAVKLVPAGEPDPDGFFLVAGENRFRIRVTNPGPTAVSGGTATLTSRSALVEVVQGQTPVGEVAAGGATELEFVVRLAAQAPAGIDVGLTLAVPGGAIPFTLVVGAPIDGAFATHDGNDVRLTVTNFGALGFWLGVLDRTLSFNELLGDGFHFPADDPTNYLFHGSFLVGRGPDQVSDDLPYGNVAQSVNDFHTLPGVPFTFLTPGPVATQEVVGAYDDSYNLEGSLGVAVRQHSYAFDEPGRRRFVILAYDVFNRTSAPLTNVHLGLFADWDFLDDEGIPSETMDYVSDLRLGVVQGLAGAPSLGIVSLDDVPTAAVSYRVLELDELQPTPGTIEIRDADKWAALSEGVRNPRETDPQDLAHLLGVGPVTIAPGDSARAAFAFVAGESATELRDAARAARETYAVEVLGREPPPPGEVPPSLTLEPPFPNPLRPGGDDLTIGFGLPASEGGAFLSSPVAVRIVDLRGRIVRTVVEEDLAPGTYERTWDGLDEDGATVPSGVYVVLLEAAAERELRKLVVLR